MTYMPFRRLLPSTLTERPRPVPRQAGASRVGGENVPCGAETGAADANGKNVGSDEWVWFISESITASFLDFYIMKSFI